MRSYGSVGADRQAAIVIVARAATAARPATATRPARIGANAKAEAADGDRRVADAERSRRRPDGGRVDAPEGRSPAGRLAWPRRQPPRRSPTRRRKPRLRDCMRAISAKRNERADRSGATASGGTVAAEATVELKHIATAPTRPRPAYNFLDHDQRLSLHSNSAQTPLTPKWIMQLSSTRELQRLGRKLVSNRVEAELLFLAAMNKRAIVAGDCVMRAT